MVGKSFRPPELQKNRPYMATQVDAWCLGWITFYLLVAQPLFMSAEMSDSGWRKFLCGKDFTNICHRKTNGTQRAQLSPKALDFVRRLMEIDPSKRMSVTESLKHPWLQEPGIPPILARGELQLMDPPKNTPLQETFGRLAGGGGVGGVPPKNTPLQETFRGLAGGGGGGVGLKVNRGRSPSPHAPIPTQGVKFRAWSPVLIPNLRVPWPVPRQGSPLNPVLSPGDSLSRGKLLNIDLRENARSLSPPPQIMIRPDFNSSKKQFAWTQVSRSPSPGPDGSRTNTPRKRAPMPIPVNGSKKDLSNGGNSSGPNVLGPTWAWPNNLMANRLSGKSGQGQFKQTPVKQGALQRSLSPGLISPIGFLKQTPNSRQSSRLAWDPAALRLDFDDAGPALVNDTSDALKQREPPSAHPGLAERIKLAAVGLNHEHLHQHSLHGDNKAAGSNQTRKNSGSGDARCVLSAEMAQQAHLSERWRKMHSGTHSTTTSPLPPASGLYSSQTPSIARAISPFRPLSPQLVLRSPELIRADPVLSWAKLQAADTDLVQGPGGRTKNRLSVRNMQPTFGVPIAVPNPLKSPGLGDRGMDKSGLRSSGGDGARGRALSPDMLTLKPLNPSFTGRLDLRTRCLSPHPPAIGSNNNLFMRALSPNPTPMGERDLPREKHHSNEMKWNAQMR